MLGQFLNVLMQVLIVKSHDLLSEEIAIVVYNMASVDFDGFYSSYLPHLLGNCDGIDDSQRALLAQNFKVDTVGSILLFVMMTYHNYVVFSTCASPPSPSPLVLSGFTSSPIYRRLLLLLTGYMFMCNTRHS